MNTRTSKYCPLQSEKCKWVDLGGAYVGPTQNRLLRVARELGVKTYLVNEKEHLVAFNNVSTKYKVSKCMEMYLEMSRGGYGFFP